MFRPWIRLALLVATQNLRPFSQATRSRSFDRRDYQPKKFKNLVALEHLFASLCAPFGLRSRTDSMFASR